MTWKVRDLRESPLIPHATARAKIALWRKYGSGCQDVPNNRLSCERTETAEGGLLQASCLTNVNLAPKIRELIFGAAAMDRSVHHFVNLHAVLAAVRADARTRSVGMDQ
jgi:hypothetical protein